MPLSQESKDQHVQKSASLYYTLYTHLFNIVQFNSESRHLPSRFQAETNAQRQIAYVHRHSC